MGCLSISWYATGADPGQILSGFRNFCPAGPGHAPLEIFENQVSQISGNWITGYLF